MRIGCTPFLNARPLVWGLEMEHDIIPLPPSRMAKALLSKRVDVALIPVVDLFRDRRLRLLPAAAIGCRGAVRSVRLLSRDALKRTTTLYADSNSGTSVLLALLLLRRVLGVRAPRVRKVDTMRFGPRSLKGGETLLQIGDIALRPAPKGLKVHDLGSLWMEWTGLPFVFAPWMVRRGSAPHGASALLKKAVREAMRVPSLVAKKYAPRGCSIHSCTCYLRHNLSFRVGSAERKAIRLFGRLLRKEGLL